MILYFADRKMNILGQAGTFLQDGMAVMNDVKTEEIDEGVAILEFNLSYDPEWRKKAETWTEVGNYILRKDGDAREFYTIISRENTPIDGMIRNVYAEDAGLDLLNEVVGSYTADKAYPVTHYIEKFSYDSGFEVGINEIANLSRKLSWEGEATATERLLSVATQFDNAEISFSFQIDRMSVVHKYINIHKKRGVDGGVQLRVGREIKDIRIQDTIEDLATAYLCKGGIPDGKEEAITLNGYKYDDGDFYVEGSYVKSRKALEKWSRYQIETESGEDVGHIVKAYSYETTSQSELCNRAISSLKKICDVSTTYEIELLYLPEGTKVGDTVYIVDRQGEMYLSSRLLKLETSVCDDMIIAVLGDYKKKGSGISDQLRKLAEDFKGSYEVLKERINKRIDEANTSASEAKEAADGALQSARDALQESKDANIKAEDAVNAANQAAQSAQDAQKKSEEASTAVEGVKEEVAGITQTVNAADTAAKEAKKAAEAAEGKAVEAKESAEAAKVEAEKATLAAGEAGEKAADAQEKAESAMGTATTAEEKADAASETAGAAKLDAEAAQKDIDTLGENLTTLENTMKVEYARKTDLTEAEASLETKIQQNAAEISSTAKKVQTIDETANNAASLAEAAQKDAQTAKEQADQATLDATAAQGKADAAKLAADNAQTDANEAKTAADAAQGVADTAEANLAKAQAELATVKEKVDATEQDILDAQEKVTAAQEAADKAKADAETAISKANTAQSAAETATSNAATAQTKADDAADKANKAQTKAEIAQEAAQEAHDLAEQAQADIEKAQNTADQAKADAKTAQETADLAKTNAANAQTKADAAAKSAADAQGVADLAKTNAENAQADLDAAKANLAEVTGRVDATAEEVKAAQADVIKAQTAADKAKADAAAAQETADTAKTNAANAQTKADQAKTAADSAQSAADKAQSAADKAQADVDALEIRTKTAETKIEQNAEKIALAATKEEVRQTLGGYYTKEQADAAITVKADEISNKVSKTYVTKETLDGLTIGGRNLARNTSSEWTEWWCPTADVTNITKRFFEIYPGDKKTGDVFTVSFDIEVSQFTAGTGGDFGLHLQGSVDDKWLVENPFTSRKYNFAYKAVAGDYTEHVSYLCTIDKDEQANSDKFTFGVRCNYSDGTGKIRFKNLKVERGNKATDWTPAPEDVEEKINDTSNELHKYVTEQSTSITNDCEKIILDALTNYVETGDLESYKSTVEAQLTLLSSQMELKFTESRQQIESVNSELQNRLNTITKYFTFDINGMTIGQVESPNKVVVDNDEISILVGDNVVQKFDALGRALIPEVSITRRMTLFGYAFTQDEKGNVNVDYVGGEQ